MGTSRFVFFSGGIYLYGALTEQGNAGLLLLTCWPGRLAAVNRQIRQEVAPARRSYG